MLKVNFKMIVNEFIRVHNKTIQQQVKLNVAQILAFLFQELLSVTTEEVSFST